MLGQSQEPEWRMWPCSWHILTNEKSSFHLHTSGTGAQGWEICSPPHTLGWSQRDAHTSGCRCNFLSQHVSQPLSITSFHWNFSRGGICKGFAYARHIWSNHDREKAMQMLPCCLLDIRGQIFPAVEQVSSPSLIYYGKIRENWSPVTGDAIM